MQTQQTFRNIFFVIGAMFIVMAVVKFSIAIGTEPLGPESITNRFSSRMTNSSFGAKWVTGAAGNVTGLTINATSPTRAWQGYFGNISGQLVLMDSDNWTFYDWYESEPEGEIYATHNSSVVWANIRCFNFTSDDGDAERGWIATNINATTENNRTGTPNHAADAINVTFSTSKNHTGFSVGTVLFNDSWCPTTYTYIDNQSQSLEFVEVLLTDGAASAGGGDSLIFMTIIEQDTFGNDTDPRGFNGQQHDFQMLVMEDGHAATGGEDSDSTFYFWVEIE